MSGLSVGWNLFGLLSGGGFRLLGLRGGSLGGGCSLLAGAGSRQCLTYCGGALAGAFRRCHGSAGHRCIAVAILCQLGQRAAGHGMAFEPIQAGGNGAGPGIGRRQQQARGQQLQVQAR